MYRFIFRYKDGKERKFENIERVTYFSKSTVQELKGNQILSHSFGLGYDYSLFSKTATFTASAENLLFIEVTEM